LQQVITNTKHNSFTEPLAVSASPFGFEGSLLEKLCEILRINNKRIDQRLLDSPFGFGAVAWGFVGWRDKDFWIKERSDWHDRDGLPERTLAGDIAVLIILIAIGLGVWIWYASL
jgi:hypothetical protein